MVKVYTNSPKIVHLKGLYKYRATRNHLRFYGSWYVWLEYFSSNELNRFCKGGISYGNLLPPKETVYSIPGITPKMRYKLAILEHLGHIKFKSEEYRGLL